MAQHTIDDIYQGLQLFKNYIHANFPFKETQFSGTANPAVSGFVAPVKSLYFRLDNDANILEIFYKSSDASDYAWEKLGSGDIPLPRPIDLSPIGAPAQQTIIDIEAELGRGSSNDGTLDSENNLLLKLEAANYGYSNIESVARLGELHTSRMENKQWFAWQPKSPLDAEYHLITEVIESDNSTSTIDLYYEAGQGLNLYANGSNIILDADFLTDADDCVLILMDGTANDGTITYTFHTKNQNYSHTQDVKEFSVYNDIYGYEGDGIISADLSTEILLDTSKLPVAMQSLVSDYVPFSGLGEAELPSDAKAGDIFYVTNGGNFNNISYNSPDSENNYDAFLVNTIAPLRITPYKQSNSEGGFIPFLEVTVGVGGDYPTLKDFYRYIRTYEGGELHLTIVGYHDTRFDNVYDSGAYSNGVFDFGKWDSVEVILDNVDVDFSLNIKGGREVKYDSETRKNNTINGRIQARSTDEDLDTPTVCFQGFELRDLDLDVYYLTLIDCVKSSDYDFQQNYDGNNEGQIYILGEGFYEDLTADYCTVYCLNANVFFFYPTCDAFYFSGGTSYVMEMEGTSNSEYAMVYARRGANITVSGTLYGAENYDYAFSVDGGVINSSVTFDESSGGQP